jgi:hypothetical protein
MKILPPLFKDSHMKYAIVLLGLLMTTASAAQDVQLRYGKPPGVVTLSTTQDIRAGEFGTTRAGRTFAMEMALEASRGSDGLAVTINKVKGSYTAHDMKQRLPTSHLAGQVFDLSVNRQGRALERTEPGPIVEMGWYLEGGFPIGLLLVDLLPVLPEAAVSMGATWTTEQETLSLEGWNWASGQMLSRHAVTALEEHDGHLIVSIRTEAEAKLGPVEGGLEYGGEGRFERTMDWRFDATSGWPVSLRMEQKTTGTNGMPKRSILLHQITTAELTLVE